MKEMEFRRFSNRRFTGWVASGLEDADQLFEKLDSAEGIPPSDVILECRGRTIYRASLPYKHERVDVYVYIFHNDTLSRALRSNYAFHSLKMSRKLAAAGFKTIQVLAALKPSRQLLNWKGLLVAREIASVRELPSSGIHRYQVHQHTDFDPNLRFALARELARLHDSGFTHGDLKSRHILTRNEGDEIPDIYFVDLEKTGFHPCSPPFLKEIRAARDLIQLFASLPPTSESSPDLELREQFLRDYFSSRCLSDTRKQLIRQMLDFYRSESGLDQGKTLAKIFMERLARRRRKTN